LNDVSELLEKLGQRVRPPGDGQADHHMAEMLAEIRKSLFTATQAAVNALDLPTRTLELLVGGLVRDTEAVLELGEPPVIAVLSGVPGCGKTTAAARWLYLGATEKRIRGFWVTAARLGRWARYDDEEMRRLTHVPRLVVDDLGTEYVDEKGAFMTTFDELLNERYAHRRPTVITTNLNGDAFKERYDLRVVDRIREDGAFRVIESKSLRSA
jgi:hypothetical protein